jgi:hypothetical protein
MCRALQGRWSVDNREGLGALISILDQIMRGALPGWVEGIRDGVTQTKSPKHIVFYSDAEALESERILKWSSMGGEPEGNDYCIAGFSIRVGHPEVALSRRTLIELLTALLERSGLDPTKSPPPLPPFDENAPYASLPYPTPPPKPPTLLRENVELMRDLDRRIKELKRNGDPKGAYEQRKQLLVDMREMGFLREDLVTSGDVGADALSLWAFLTSFEELRKYYRSAYRKTVFGPEPAPNVIGGPISHQFFRTCRLWYPNAKQRTLDDYRDSRNKIIVADDEQHPHEVLAILETEMRRLSDLGGDFGERRVEHDTFKALFRWEREDGAHASLTFANVDSW